MCCLRYEFEAYKDFHSRAPKKNARIDTPDGEGKVVDMDVPREVISIKVGDEKPVKVPLADMDAPEEGKRPTSVGEEAWERANAPVTTMAVESLNLFTTQLSGDDKLAEPGKVSHMPKGESSKSSRSRRRRGGSGRAGSGEAPKEQESSQRKQRRRRSTTVSSDGSTKVTEQGGEQADHKDKEASSSSRRRRRRSSSAGSASKQEQQGKQQQSKTSQVGRNSSALRSGRSEQGVVKGESQEQGSGAGSGQKRRRRRSHKTNSSGGESKSAE